MKSNLTKRKEHKKVFRLMYTLSSMSLNIENTFLIDFFFFSEMNGTKGPLFSSSRRTCLRAEPAYSNV